jgi:hypothetical protein
MEPAEEAFAQGLKCLDQVLEQGMGEPATWPTGILSPTDPPKEQVLEFLGTIIGIARPEWSRRTMAKAETFYTRLLSARPGDPVCKQRLARTLYYQAMFAFAHEEQNALEIAQRSAKLYEELLVASPDKQRCALEMAQLCIHTAAMLDFQRRYQDVAPWSERARAALELPDLGAGPGLLPRQFYFIMTQQMIRQERYVDALQSFQRVISTDVPAPALILTLYATTVAKARGQIYGLLRKGEYETAVAQANVLANLPNIAGEALYDGACVHGVAAAAAKDPEVREKYAARSVELLRRAFATGFGKDPFQKMSGILGDPVQHMEQDRDLAAIRNREDYRAFLAELKRKP